MNELASMDDIKTFFRPLKMTYHIKETQKANCLMALTVCRCVKSIYYDYLAIYYDLNQ